MMFPGKGWPVWGSMMGVPSRAKLPVRKSASGTVAVPTPVFSMASRS